MFKLKKGTCKGQGCGATDVFIVYKAGSLCFHCNQKRLQAKRKPYRYVKKATGEKEMFLEIWSERAHICTNCQKTLGAEPYTFFFSHIKSKGAHPELRLDKSNIQLLCFDCHKEYDQGTKERFEKLKVVIRVPAVNSGNAPK
jgi:5-methylcytosine-specific restriction endonuclease McrA